MAAALPDVSVAFGDQSLGPTLVVSAYILAITALIVPVGCAGDHYGTRSVLMLGLCLFILGAVFAFLAPSLPLSIFCRLVLRAGAAALTAMPLAIVRGLVQFGQTGRWTGALGTMTAIGTASGHAVAGTFALCCVLTLCVACLSVLARRNSVASEESAQF